MIDLVEVTLRLHPNVTPMSGGNLHEQGCDGSDRSRVSWCGTRAVARFAACGNVFSVLPMSTTRLTGKNCSSPSAKSSALACLHALLPVVQLRIRYFYGLRHCPENATKNGIQEVQCRSVIRGNGVVS